jgi:hypothetical protein
MSHEINKRADLLYTMCVHQWCEQPVLFTGLIAMYLGSHEGLFDGRGFSTLASLVSLTLGSALDIEANGRTGPVSRHPALVFIFTTDGGAV